MAPKDKDKDSGRKTVVKDKEDGWKHSTSYDPSTNNRWSVDYRETTVGGVGSNWTEVRGAHHTDQTDNSHDDNVRYGESTSTRSDDD
jgi:hypothetical protein